MIDRANSADPIQLLLQEQPDQGFCYLPFNIHQLAVFLQAKTKPFKNQDSYND